MFKARKKLIAKIILLAICTSVMPTTFAFAEENGGTQSTGTTVVQTTGSAVSVANESDKQTTEASETAINNSGFEFDSATGTITGYTGSNTDVVIPSEINGVKVKSIGDGAFGGNNSLKSITIPDSVISIGDNAFYSCWSLRTLKLPSGVKNIGSGAFYGCRLLFNVNVPNSVTSIGTDAFCIDMWKESDPEFISFRLYVESANVKQLLLNSGVFEKNIILKNSTVQVSSIKLSVKNGGDQTFTLVSAIAPSNATNKTLSWTSSNTKVAIVDNNGNITYVGKGNATITCTATDGSKVSKSFYVQNDYYTSQIR